MKYQIRHHTDYAYTDSVLTCHNLAHLTPRNLSHQQCLRSSLTIQPPPMSISQFNDYFGNAVNLFSIFQPHTRMTITADSEVEITEHAAIDLAQTSSWETVLTQIRSEPHPIDELQALDASQYWVNSDHIQLAPELADYARPSFFEGRPMGEAAMDLTTQIFHEFKYAPNTTTLTTSILEVLQEKRGVCQDFAHLMIGCLRSMGLPARYVSGYLRTDPPPGKPRLVGADASHAWVSVFCPPVGWIDFDPTNGCMTSERHIVLAWGRDFADVSPIRGSILGGSQHKLTVSVDVQPTAND